MGSTVYRLDRADRSKTEPLHSMLHRVNGNWLPAGYREEKEVTADRAGRSGGRPDQTGSLGNICITSALDARSSSSFLAERGRAVRASTPRGFRTPRTAGPPSPARGPG